MRSYKELGEVGLVVTERAGGTRVAAAQSSATRATTRQHQLAELTHHFLLRARALGASDDEIEAAIVEALLNK